MKKPYPPKTIEFNVTEADIDKTTRWHKRSMARTKSTLVTGNRCPLATALVRSLRLKPGNVAVFPTFVVINNKWGLNVYDSSLSTTRFADKFDNNENPTPGTFTLTIKDGTLSSNETVVLK